MGCPMGGYLVVGVIIELCLIMIFLHCYSFIIKSMYHSRYYHVLHGILMSLFHLYSLILLYNISALLMIIIEYK